MVRNVNRGTDSLPVNFGVLELFNVKLWAVHHTEHNDLITIITLTFDILRHRACR